MPSFMKKVILSQSNSFLKWTNYCYKRWLWTFGAWRELDVVVANINGQLTGFA